MKKSNYDKYPSVVIDGHTCIEGWTNIVAELEEECKKIHEEKIVIVIEYYPGVYLREIEEKFLQHIPGAILFDSSTAMKTNDEIEKMVYPFVTDNPVFGYMSPLNLPDFFDAKKIASMQEKLNAVNEGICIIYGIGASLISPKPNLLFYADMPRWEIQLRFRNKTIDNMGAQNQVAEFSYLYKRSFFVDWRVCDRHKKRIMNDWDYVLDTTIPNDPKLISDDAFKDALRETVSRPFRV
ncbi:MAG: mannose-6-phosphate isomerase, partial [Bacteroidota bacterium]|nr:mannose-6-phosphate isomerase [Bacteroidota bacterium]